MNVEDLLGRYGIRVEWYPWGPERHVPAVDSMGPSGSAGIRWPDVVVAEENVGVAAVLHEGMHLIFGTSLEFHRAQTETEDEGLLQLERSLARYLHPRERRAVIDYQSITTLGFDHVGQMCRRHQRTGYAEVGDWKRPTRTWWWREGAAKAVALGLLTPDGRPTWKRRSARR